MSFKRKRAGPGDGRRFTVTAMKVHKKNIIGPMRGGIRL